MAIKAVQLAEAPVAVLRQIWNVQFVGAAGNDNILVFDALQSNAPKGGAPLSNEVGSLVLEGSVFTLRCKEPIEQVQAVQLMNDLLNKGIGSGYTVEAFKNDAVRVIDWKVEGQSHPFQANDVTVARYKSKASNVDDMPNNDYEPTQLEKDLASFDETAMTTDSYEDRCMRLISLINNGLSTIITGSKNTRERNKLIKSAEYQALSKLSNKAFGAQAGTDIKKLEALEEEFNKLDVKITPAFLPKDMKAANITKAGPLGETAGFALIQDGKSDDSQGLSQVPHTAGQKLGNQIAGEPLGEETADNSSSSSPVTNKPTKPAPLSTLNPNPTKMSTPQRK